VIVKLSETKLIQALTRELRSYDGMERTPNHVRCVLLKCKTNRKHTTLTLSAFICRLLDDPDLLAKFADEMKLPDQDKIPTSAELGL
jgi:hypothetical protein